MPWNADYYPASMIRIANALLESGHPEGQAIRIAIAQAKAWAQHA